MPLYNFACPYCQATVKKIMTVEKMKAGVTCYHCYADLVRTPTTGASSQIKEVFDNGLMARPVERYADAETLFKNRSVTVDEDPYEGDQVEIMDGGPSE